MGGLSASELMDGEVDGFASTDRTRTNHHSVKKRGSKSIIHMVQ